MYFISLQGAGNITHEILRLRSGSVRLINFVSQNQSLTDLKERARSLAVVTQNIEVGSMTIEEYVLMGRIPYHKPFQFFETKADIAITQKHMELTGVTRLKDKFMNALSGGEQQLAGIVRALTQEPELLLLDKPTSHLDITYQVTNFEFNQFGYYF